jgi:hypothetical protein
VADLRARLGDLRAAAAAILAGLSADPPITGPARAWGLTGEDASEVLGARIDAAGDPAEDDAADAATLGGRIHALLDPSSGLPLVCIGAMPGLTAAPDIDRDWLEIVAAVRPALSRLEAHQIATIWPAAASDPAALWSVPSASQRTVIAYGPGVAADGAVGIALLDDWAETVPSSKHTTHAAFGFDAPRARAQQAVLLAVPPDEQVPITADSLPSIVLSTRALARARMAQPDQLGAWTVAVPTSMVLAAGRAGSALEETP